MEDFQIFLFPNPLYTIKKSCCLKFKYNQLGCLSHFDLNYVIQDLSQFNVVENCC